MNTCSVAAIFAFDTGKIYGTDSVCIAVVGYGMRNALSRLLSALGDVPILSVSVTDSHASAYIPTAYEDAAFSSVIREFPI